MKKNLPKYMMIYKCSECGMDSGYTEEEENPVCRMCEHETKMELISKQEITPELMADRLKELTDRIMSNLQSAYEGMTEEDKGAFPAGEDPEKQMLLLLDKAKKLRDHIHDLELTDPEKNESGENEKKNVGE